MGPSNLSGKSTFLRQLILPADYEKYGEEKQCQKHFAKGGFAGSHIGVS